MNVGLCKLGNIATIKSGGTPLKSKPEFWGGSIPWYSSGELNWTFTQAPNQSITEEGLKGSNSKLFPKGSLLIGMYDTAALKMSLLDRDAAFNQAIAGIEPNKNIDLKYIMSAINAVKPDLLKQRRGVRQKNLSLSKIKDIEIPLPPLPEQRRIVAILDEAFAGIDAAMANTRRNLANARALFENHLNAVFSQKGDGWVETTIGAFCDTQYGISGQMNAEGVGFKIFRMGEVQGGRLVDTGHMKCIDIPSEEFQKYKLNHGDVLFNRTNSIDLVGKTGIYCGGDEHCFASYLVRLVLDPEKMNSNFLCHLMNSSVFLDRIRNKAARSVNQANINATILRNEVIAYPTRMDLQEGIAAEIDELSAETQRLEALYQRKLEALAELKQSILQKAFSGQLTTQEAAA